MVMSVAQGHIFLPGIDVILPTDDIMMQNQSTRLASSVFVVILYCMLLMHTVVLPGRGPLVDTLNLITSLRNPAIAASLLYSSLASVISLFWSLTEFLNKWEPWSQLLLLVVADAVKCVWRWWSALGTRSAFTQTTDNGWGKIP
jgi:hypothetical protein